LRKHGEPLVVGPCRCIPTANSPQPQVIAGQRNKRAKQKFC
jgi:hypothetical protein